MSELPAELNESQRQAVTATEGMIRVIAGAGSGKTMALSQRFAFLVREIGILPSGILCVTFTNKSAGEMKRRIRRLTGDSDTGYIGTFHSFCVTVLQEDIHAVQYPKNFLVLDNADIDAMLHILYEERGLTLRHKTFSQARDMIEIRKLFKDPEYYEWMISLSLEQLHQKYLDARSTDDIIFWGYLYQEKKCFGLDYNDLIKYVLYLFEREAPIRLKWQQRLQYLMIDEFQDIDELQYRLMKVLCAHHKNLFVVGDPDQTVYTWRGADVKFLLDFDKEFPGVRTILMTQNYRSTPQILAVANSLIRSNKNRIEKDLLPTLPDGAPVVCHHAKTAEAEAGWIAAKIKKLLECGAKLSEIAILYRAHFLSRTLEEVFRRETLPYTIYSGVQFFGRAEIKDALSYLRLIAYQDDLSFLRVANVPKRNLGQRRMKFLKEYAAEHGCSLLAALGETIEQDVFRNTKAARLLDLIGRFSRDDQDRPISDLLSAVLDQSGYESMLRTEGSQERLDNLAELKQAIYEFENTGGEECTLENYLSHVALMTNSDTGADKQAVKLMTVHTAKGLEFPYVFVCGLDEGVFPSKKTATRQAMEEERRLAFVAFTRAGRGLYLTDSEGRNLDGSYRCPSRFIFNVDRSLLSFTGEWEEELIRESGWRVAASEQFLDAADTETHFRPGDRVTHSIMGGGEILAVDREKAAYLIQFDSLETPRTLGLRTKLTAG